MKKISLIIPLYNEADNLPALRDALLPLIDNRLTDRPYRWEVLLVNDGSRDNSAGIIARFRADDPRFRDINLSRNFGKECALAAGFDHVTGDAAVIMDADLQHPVGTIPLMISEWEQGWHDIYGRRSSRDADSWLKRVLTRRYYRLLQRSTRIDVLPDAGDFRLLDRRCVNALRTLRENQRNTKGLYCWIGFRKKEVLFDCADRVAGKSSYSFMRLLNLAVDGITGFTTAPLRFATILGILTAFASLVYLLYIAAKTMIYGEPVQGFPTIMCTILFLGGSQLLAIGIIGEYIARIFNETKGRPVYIIDTVDGHTPGHDDPSGQYAPCNKI